jgi:hypothetical protein
MKGCEVLDVLLKVMHVPPAVLIKFLGQLEGFWLLIVHYAGFQLLHPLTGLSHL